MAFDFPPLKKNPRRLVAEINVAPLVDVMLILLIVFMIAAPMMIQGVEVDLPETTAQPLRQAENSVVISINKDGEIYFEDIRSSQLLLQQQLAALAQRLGTDQIILLRADQGVLYGLVVAVMTDIKNAGFDQLGMITQTPSP